MKVIIENMFFGWHENAPETFIKLINSLVVAKDETEVRNVMQHFAQSSIFNTIFAYGFGALRLRSASPLGSPKDDNRLRKGNGEPTADC